MTRSISARIHADAFFSKIGLKAALLAGLCLSGWIRQYLPETPVPLTLQVFFVFLAAMWLGAAGSMSVIAAYLAIGALGAPIFSSGAGGWAQLFGPQAVTAGYLFGFLAAAAITGRAFEKATDFHAPRDAFFLAAGLAAMYACGAVWFKIVSGASWGAVWTMSVAPFVAVDAMKIACAYILVRAARRRRSATAR